MNESLPSATTSPNPLELGVTLEYADRVNFGMHHNGLALVQNVILTNTQAVTLNDLSITIRLENQECQPWTTRLDRLDPGITHTLSARELKLNPSVLAVRTESQRTQLIVQIDSPNASLTRTFPTDLLAFDHWPGIGHWPQMTAAFVTPNHSLVAQCLQAARQSLGKLSGSDALDGYQSASRTRAAHIAQACYNALASLQWGYINPPASFENEGQRVRLIDRLCREKLGTCLDLALALASLIEQTGLNPLILITEGHAFVAVWTHAEHLAEPVLDEPAQVRNLVELGQIVPIEATLLTQRRSDFTLAVEAGKSALRKPGRVFCAIDIRTCRKAGIRPLPLRDTQALEPTSLDLTVAAATSAPSPLDALALAERAERQTVAVGHATPSDRIQRWRNHLLDLSLRNRLINFRAKGRTVPLTVPDLPALEDALANEKAFIIDPRSQQDPAFLLQAMREGHLHADLTVSELQKQLLEIYRTVRLSIEETGANLLHLALGTLVWYESDSSDAAHRAPLILLPVKLTRTTSKAGYQYKLSLTEEPLRPNITLLEKLRTDFGIDTSSLQDLPEDENGLDVALILRNFRSVIRDLPRWEVEESAHLALFSFNKFLMWRDLTEHLQTLLKNRLLTHLVQQPDREFDATPFPKPGELDKTLPPDRIFCTRDADSSQLAAVHAANLGKSFVLEGPPGTGKSQTIANMIANALANGKRVLFVAEKMAALDVVHQRLQSDGLGSYCLELHSAKASKKQVLAQLQQAMETTATNPGTNWNNLCDDLHETRSHLNAYVHEMHQIRPVGLSLFEALGRLCHLKDAPRIKLPDDLINKPTQDRLRLCRQAVHSLHTLSATVQPVSNHPLRGIGQSHWQFDLPTRSRQALGQALDKLSVLRIALQQFAGGAGIDLPADQLSRPAVQIIATLAHQLRQVDSPLPDVRLILADAMTWHEKIRIALDLSIRHDEERSRLLTLFRPEFLDINPLPHIDALTRASRLPLPLRLLFTILASRKLRPYALAKLPAPSDLLLHLETVASLKRLAADLARQQDVASLLGPHWNNAHPDPAHLRQLLETSLKLQKPLQLMQADPSLRTWVPTVAMLATSDTALKAIRDPAQAIIRAWNNWSTSWESLKDILQTSSQVCFGSSGDPFLSTAETRFSKWRDHLDQLDQWCAWRSACANAQDAGLGDLLQRYEDGRLTRDQLVPAFERSFHEDWFNATANSIDIVRTFNAHTHQQAIDRFGQMDLQAITQSRHVITSRLSFNLPAEDVPVSRQSELGVLRRELQKKTKHMPPRQLIGTIPNLLAKLKPCFLMSPLSVAQYLNADLPPFDLVIFDEASQIPVWDAAGAIARGKEVIVVGDSKQLPPTSFFDTLDSDDETPVDEPAVPDMESILKECNASGVPSMRLRWHYRSRHESLIAFSNQHYYDNALHTFPSPQERSGELGVSLRYVQEGVYDRGHSRTNRIEAQRVVDHVIDLLSDPSACDSLGIVTFNQAQQRLIEDLLDDARRNRPDIDRHFTAEVREPVFVKNLENVQGDERDSILFSVGYGPDQHGVPSMNFGPLNKDGGERRLNVAVTRARKRLIVFSSLKAEQIDLRRTQAIGVRHFKTFLDYADRGPGAINQATSLSGHSHHDSPFEKAVCDALRARGWDVDLQVGCAGYRIDLAVRCPHRPGRYLLGIECDGASYHSAQTARDRDRLRQAVLENLGWYLCRVWSTDWWINPQRCLQKIEERLQQLLAESVAPSPQAFTTTPPPPIVPDVATAVMSASAIAPAPLATRPPASPVIAAPPSLAPAAGEPIQFTLAQPADGSLESLDFYDDQAFIPAAEALVRIIQIEGPVMEEVAMRRLLQWFGLQRITQRSRTRFMQIKQAAMFSKAIREEEGTFWPANLEESTFIIFRVPGDNPATHRDLECIPLVELMNAMVYVITLQFGMPAEELHRQTARLFGIQRPNPRQLDRLHEALQSAVTAGKLIESQGNITLP